MGWEYPEIFIKPTSLYISSIAKELIQQNQSVVAFVGSQHYHDVWKHLQDNIYYQKLDISKYSNLITLIDKFFNPNHKALEETESELIEKNAILDNLLDTFMWFSDEINNPFCYISENPDHFKSK